MSISPNAILCFWFGFCFFYWQFGSLQIRTPGAQGKQLYNCRKFTNRLRASWLSDWSGSEASRLAMIWFRCKQLVEGLMPYLLHLADSGHCDKLVTWPRDSVQPPFEKGPVKRMCGFYCNGQTFKRASVNLNLLQVVCMLITNNITLKYAQTNSVCLLSLKLG